MKNYPTQPDQSQLATGRHNRGFPAIPENPSGVRAGLSSASRIETFPRKAVESLRGFYASERPTPHSGEKLAIGEVLAWIDRFIPHALPGCTIEPATVGAIQTLVIENTGLEDLDLVRVDGRVFVPETPAIEFEGPFTADACQLWQDGDPEGAAVFSSDGQPFCMVDGATIVGGDPMPRAVAIARILNEAAQGIDDQLLAQAALALAAAYDERFEGAPGDPDPGEVFDAIRERLGVDDADVIRTIALDDHNPDRFVHASPEVAAVIADAVAKSLHQWRCHGCKRIVLAREEGPKRCPSCKSEAFSDLGLAPPELLLTPEMEAPRA